MSETPAAAPAKGGGKSKLLIGVVVLALAGGAAYWFMGRGEPAKAEEPGLETRGLLIFEPVLVNLSDGGGQRFVKATIQLVLETAHDAESVHKTPVVMSAIRSSMLELLAQQQSSVLVTPDGKTELKKQLKERAEAHLKQTKVIDVLFSEFVVQF
jgi:flagellar FliL protein